MWVGGARKDIIKEVKRASSILCETQIEMPRPAAFCEAESAPLDLLESGMLM